MGLFMIISFLLNFSGLAEGEQRNNSLQVSVSGLELLLLPHVVGEMRMYDCRPRRKGWHVAGPGKAVVGLMPYLRHAEAARGLAPELAGSSV